MNNLPEDVKNADETEIVVDAAAPAEETSPADFFAYDEAYAKKMKTFAQPVHKLMAIFGALIVGFLTAFIPMLLLPDDSIWGPVALIGGILIVLFGLFGVPCFFKNKLDAWFKSFLADGDKVWMVRFYPFTANSKQASMAGMQQVYNNACFKASHNRDTVAAVVETVKANKRPGKSSDYKKATVLCMGNVKIMKAGRIAKIAYVTPKNKVKNVKIADCYPGLFEYINK